MSYVLKHFIIGCVDMSYMEQLTQRRRRKQRHRQNHEREEALNKPYVRNKPPVLVVTSVAVYTWV